MGIKKFIFLLFIALLINLLIPTLYLLLKTDIKSMFFNAHEYLLYRSFALILPDGAYGLFVIGFSSYLFYAYKNKYLRILFVFSLMAGIASIFLTFSRIFLPGFFVLLMFILIFILPKKVKIILTIFVILLFLFIGKHSIVDRLSDRVHQSDPLTLGSGRFVLINEVYNIFASDIKNLVYGIGTGNHFYYSFKFIKDPIWFNLSSPHNQLLTIFLETGLFGYLVFIYFIISLLYFNFKRIQNLKDQENKILYLSLTGIFISFLSMSLFADMIISYHPPMTHYLVFLWMIMGVLTASNLITNET